jgi:hypothetical protein
MHPNKRSHRSKNSHRFTNKRYDEYVIKSGSIGRCFPATWLDAKVPLPAGRMWPLGSEQATNVRRSGAPNPFGHV